MKKFLLLYATILNSFFANAQLNFTITNVSGTSTITCERDTIDLVACSNYSSAVVYNWSGPVNIFGEQVRIGVPGSYTITATSNSLSASKVLVIGLDISYLSSSIIPLSQSISCNPGSVTTITAVTNYSLNPVHYFVAPTGGTLFSSSSTATFTPSAPGTYTHFVTNGINGCRSSKTFTVSGGQGMPAGYLQCSQNFSTGCSTKSFVTIHLSNFTTSPTQGGSLSYTLLSPTTNTSIPQGSLSPQTSYSINTPGIWTAIIRDNNTACDLKLPFSILQNTLAPYLSMVVPSTLLSCYTPTVQLKAYADKPFPLTYLKWNSHYLAIMNGNSTIPFIHKSIPTSTVVDTYTLVATDLNNLCISVNTVTIYQNIFPPVAKIGTGGVDPCTNENTLLTNLSTSGIPLNSQFSSSLAIDAIAWSRYGNILQTTTPATHTFQTPQQGVYTMTVIDLNNGCMSSTITNMTFCVGMKEELNNEAIVKIYPNPGKGTYTILSEIMNEEKSYEVYTLAGELILQEKTSAEKWILDLNNRPEGLYIFILKRKNKNQCASKIIKQ